MPCIMYTLDGYKVTPLDSSRPPLSKVWFHQMYCTAPVAMWSASSSDSGGSLRLSCTYSVLAPAGCILAVAEAVKTNDTSAGAASPCHCDPGP
jgi:hypothetical protein